MKKFHFLITTFLFPFYLIAAQKTIVCGQLSSPKKSVTLQFFASTEDCILGNRTVLEQALDANNNFHFAVDVDKPIEIQLMAGEDWLISNKVLLPSDSLRLTFTDSGVSTSGSAEAYMDFQFEYDKQFNNRDSFEVFRKAWQEPDHIKFAAKMQEGLQRKKGFLKQYAVDNPVPEDYFRVYNAFLELKYLADLAQLSWKEPIGKSALLDTGYLKYLHSFDLNNPDYASSDLYDHALREIPYGIWSTLKNNAGPDDLPLIENNQLPLRDSIASSIFKGQTLEHAKVLLSKDLIEALDQSKGSARFDSMKSYTSDFIKSTNGSLKTAILQTAIERRFQEVISERLLIKDLSLVDLSGKPVHFSDFLGKVVYIDVWATDCMPCIAEIPHMKQLQKKYENQNDLAFLFISFDRNKDFLNEFINTKEISGYHSIAPNGFSSDFANTYEIRGIPRYFVLDKKNRLVTKDALRPSSNPSILLDALLKE